MGEAETVLSSDDRGNRILGHDPIPDSFNVRFTANAQDCTLRVGKSAKLRGNLEFRRVNGDVTIGANANLAGVHILLGDNATIRIGDGTFVGPQTELSTAEGATLSIGTRCLIGAYNIVRSDDAHPFYDLATGARLNRAQSTTVADGVWTGRGATILPGSHIESGSILGAQTVVTAGRPIPANVVAVGNPARVVRRNVRWLYKHVQQNTDVPESITPEPMPEPVVEIIAPPSLLQQARRFAGRVKRALIAG